MRAFTFPAAIVLALLVVGCQSPEPFTRPAPTARDAGDYIHRFALGTPREKVLKELGPPTERVTASSHDWMLLAKRDITGFVDRVEESSVRHVQSYDVYWTTRPVGPSHAAASTDPDRELPLILVVCFYDPLERLIHAYQLYPND